MSELNPLEKIVASELQNLVRDGHARRDENGIYELTQTGWELFRFSQRIPLSLAKDANTVIVPMDLIETFTLLLEGLIFNGLNPQTMLREQAQRVGLPTGRILRLRVGLDEVIHEMAEFYQAADCPKAGNP